MPWIGQVYEGLLDHTAKRLGQPALGLIGRQGRAIPLASLERRRSKGERGLSEYLTRVTGLRRPRAHSAQPCVSVGVADRLRTACGQDESLLERVLPFADLIRDDALGQPLVIPAGGVCLSPSTDRRRRGTHYTPPRLTEPIVRHTLDPLVYAGPAEGTPADRWAIKRPEQLLELKICDMACGSGAFLLQAATYLAQRLVEAWDEHGNPEPGPGTPPPTPNDPAQRSADAMRLVVQRCLYGLDKDPLAVELARLCLWLLCGKPDMPTGWLNHAIRCGDALVGLGNLEQLRRYRLTPASGGAPHESPWLSEAVDRATRGSQPVEPERLAGLSHAADLLVAAAYWSDSNAQKQRQLRRNAERAAMLLEGGNPRSLEATAKRQRRTLRPLHWPLAFPEVILARGGFDAFIGNPPFVNAIEGALDDRLKRWLSEVSPGLGGTADLAYHFLHRADRLLRPGGCLGLLLPRGFLVAPAAERLRAALLERRRPYVLMAPDQPTLFPHANIFVVAAILGPVRQSFGARSIDEADLRPIQVDGGNWWAPLQRSTQPEPVASHAGKPTRLAEIFEVCGSMTTGMAYELVPFLSEQPAAERHRLVTTGLIDPGRCEWGRRRCRYLKRDYTHPAITNPQALPASFRRRIGLWSRPKILVAGLSNRLEAFLDAQGVFCGVVQTFTITHPRDDANALSALCGFLNGESATAILRSELGANAMGGGRITVKKTFLAGMPLPAHFRTDEG
jgi:hypothetical protein